MKKSILAVTALGMALTSCGLLGNVISGGPGFAGGVNGTAPAASNYGLSMLRFTSFGGANTEQSETAAFATAIQITGGVGGFSGTLVATLDLGTDTQRFYKFIVYEDKTNDAKYDMDATNGNGEKDRLLADSTNGKAAGGNRFLVFAKTAGEWTSGKPIKAGWNMVTDVDRNTTTDVNLGRGDDVVTQSLAGITITYPTPAANAKSKASK